MQLGEKEALGVAGVLVGWLVGVWTNGLKIGAIKARFEKTEKTVEVHSEELVALRQHHDDDLRSLREFFSTAAGGQKFITFPDHDLICDKNNKMTIAAIHTLTEVVKENTGKVSTISHQMQRLQVDVAVLKERRQNGSRNDEEKD